MRAEGNQEHQSAEKPMGGLDEKDYVIADLTDIIDDLNEIKDALVKRETQLTKILTRLRGISDTIKKDLRDKK